MTLGCSEPLRPGGYGLVSCDDHAHGGGGGGGDGGGVDRGDDDGQYQRQSEKYLREKERPSEERGEQQCCEWVKGVLSSLGHVLVDVNQASA